ncbi:MAG: bacterial Ig-like domain-containing protein [Ruminococcus sp.]|nr:bacterial Ig-like domain-containing protein [Ruminococcus sp.]
MLGIDKLPTKTVYEIGEPLELDGGYASGHVQTAGGAFGDTFSQPFTSTFFKIDASEFDNTKAGTYTIKISYGTATQTFEVTVNPPKTTNTTDGNTTDKSTLVGDSNLDEVVNISDAVLIMQALANPSKYGITGTDATHITAQGMKNADCDGSDDGMTNADALTIQKFVLGLVKTLPPQ